MRMVAFGLLPALMSCRPAADRPAIDLVAALPAAERRAAGIVADAIRVEHAADAAPASLLLRAPARVTWTVRLPDSPSLTTMAALAPGPDGRVGDGVTIRIGLSDDRYYEDVLRLALTASAAPTAGQPIALDLRKYSGWQWSLFYRPASITWKLILNADATPGGTVALRNPSIVARD